MGCQNPRLADVGVGRAEVREFLHLRHCTGKGSWREWRGPQREDQAGGDCPAQGSGILLLLSNTVPRPPLYIR